MSEIEQYLVGTPEEAEVPGSFAGVLGAYEHIREHELALETVSIKEAAAFFIAAYRHRRDLSTDAPRPVIQAAEDLDARSARLLLGRIADESDLSLDNSLFLVSELVRRVNEYDGFSRQK